MTRKTIALLAVLALPWLASCNKDEPAQAGAAEREAGTEVEAADREAEPTPEPEAEPEPEEPSYCEPETFREWLGAYERGCADPAVVCESIHAEDLLILAMEAASPQDRARMVVWANDGNVEDARGMLLLAGQIREKYECEGAALRRPGRSEEDSLRRLNQVMIECNRALREGRECSAGGS